MAVTGELHDALEREAKRLLVDATYSARGQLAAGSRWGWWHTLLGLPLAVLSAATASGAGLNAVAGGNTAFTAALAFISVLLQAVNAFLRPGERAHDHNLKGNQYLTLRNGARFFLEIEMRTDDDPSKLNARLRDLRDRHNALNESEPGIPGWAYATAKEGIARGEADYEDDPVWKSLG